MASGNEKPSSALTLLRRAGTAPVMSLVKIGTGASVSAAMTRMILRNIHMAFLSRNQEIIELNSVENDYAPTHKDGEEPVLKFVRVAVKPPAVPKKVNQWDEMARVESPNSKKWSGGLAGQGRKKNPPFVLEEIPFDDWRKHYAKNKYGQYRGTEAPAEDCILLPEDEIKWRSKPSETAAEESTPDEDSLPQMQEIKRAATFPEYREIDPELSLHPEKAAEIPIEKEEAVFIEADGHTEVQIVEAPKAEIDSQTPPMSPTSPTSPDDLNPPTSPTSPRSKKSWKDRVERGTRFAMLARSTSAKILQ